MRVYDVMMNATISKRAVAVIGLNGAHRQLYVANTRVRRRSTVWPRAWARAHAHAVATPPPPPPTTTTNEPNQLKTNIRIKTTKRRCNKRRVPLQCDSFRSACPLNGLYCFEMRKRCERWRRRTHTSECDKRTMKIMCRLKTWNYLIVAHSPVCMCAWVRVRRRTRSPKIHPNSGEFIEDCKMQSLDLTAPRWIISIFGWLRPSQWNSGDIVRIFKS